MSDERDDEIVPEKRTKNVDDKESDGDNASNVTAMHKGMSSLDDVEFDELFILPFLGSPIFPGMIAPINIGAEQFSDSLDALSPPKNQFIGLIAVKDELDESMTTDNLYRVGTLARVIKRLNLPDGGLHLLVNTLKRFRVTEFSKEAPYNIFAKVEYVVEKKFPDDFSEEESMEIKVLTSAVLNALRTLAQNNSLLLEQIKLTLANVDGPSKIADFAVGFIRATRSEYQEILEMDSLKSRLQKILKFLEKEVKYVRLQENIQKQTDSEIGKKQRDFFLREQLKFIKKELGLDGEQKKYHDFADKIKKLRLPKETLAYLNKELDKFMSMDTHASEYHVLYNYLDIICSLPWTKKTKDSQSLKRAESVLNKEHYGLRDVKERILEFLAVRQLKKNGKQSGSIICFVGPPGVGKTSLGRSIANAMNRKFFRFSVGGMRDEAEIKGHRRTYVAAMPGKIIQGLRKTGYSNPVFMLDEIDKMGSSFQGDPASALLEVLDPEQNFEFTDHYLDVAFDLSDVFFIVTANTLDSIPSPLLDRMEVIRLSGYIEDEKHEITRLHIVPKQLEKHGLSKENLKLSKEMVLYVIRNHTRENGIRNLERMIEKICRKIAIKVVKKDETWNPTLKNVPQIRALIGPPSVSNELCETHLTPGVASGLAWTSLGGAVLLVEAVAIPKVKPELKLTGQLGSIMSESAQIAYSHVRKIMGQEYNSDFFNQYGIHLHVPEGATPKDGPSAGITMASALLSLALNRPIKKHLSMTGELTLSGSVWPIGGLREKLIAAKRNKLTTILFPRENVDALEEIPLVVKEDLDLKPMSNFEDVREYLFEEEESV